MLLNIFLNSSKPTFKGAGAGVGAGEKNSLSRLKTDLLRNTGSCD